jgi:heat shock protein HtpX
MQTSQLAITGLIALNFYAMNCEVFQLTWLYVGIVTAGGFLIWNTKHYVNSQCDFALPPPRNLQNFEHEFGVNIKILPTQKIKAFVYKKEIYLSVGLIERLDPNELRAVIAHEKYHIKNSPKKIFSSLLALTSLTFKSHNDESMADSYAAEIAGLTNLVSAFEKLEIVDRKKRIKKLAS